MSTVLVDTGQGERDRSAGRRRSTVRRRPNLIGGFGAFVWLFIILVPVYYVVVTSLRTQAGFFEGNPLAVPTAPTLDNYHLVLANDFATYFRNSVVVTLATVVVTVSVSLMAAYVVVRRTGRGSAVTYKLFLIGLAIPLQATIIPIYFMITRLELYDTLLALILPSIAFAIPLTVVILANFLRDVPKELFDAMRVDGANDWRVLWNLVLPVTKPAVITVAIYDGLTVWNGFLFPLILTQSPEQRVLPLALWTFQGQFTVNIPAVLAAVVLSTLPILALYIVGRRQLVSGLTAGFGK
jgi:raffinose/stachyose/melibiose transport system permease protein